MYKVFSVQSLYPDVVKDYKQAKNKLFAVYLSSNYQFCHSKGKTRKMVAINIEAAHCPSLFDSLLVKEYCLEVIDSLNKVKKQVVKKKRKTKNNPTPQNDKPLMGTMEYYSHKVLMRNNKKIIQILAATDDLKSEVIFDSEQK